MADMNPANVLFDLKSKTGTSMVQPSMRLFLHKFDCNLLNNPTLVDTV